MNQSGASRKILLVDDDKMLVETLTGQLKLHEEFTVIAAVDGADALAKAKAEYFDAVLLDAALPDMDGREVCRLMRRAGVHSPVIILTASGADADTDTVLGLDAGANDCVTKPFRLSALLARLRAHIRQHECSDDAVFVIGPYAFQPAAKIMVDETRGAKVRLTDKETAILKHLQRAGGQTVGREALLDEVWGYSAGVTTHTLETHIYRLRQKIEKDPADARILVTEPGGYRLAADAGE